MKRFEVFHQRCLRRILRIKWFHRVKNVDVLNRAGINSIETFIAAMPLRWYGHVTLLRGCQKSGFLITLLTGLLNMANALVEGHANHGLTVYERMLLYLRTFLILIELV